MMKLGELDILLLKVDSEKYLKSYLVTIDDLFDNYSVLSDLVYHDNDRDRLLQLLCMYVLLENRNKKVLAKKILYKIIKNSTSKVDDPTIIDLLFDVYKNNVFINSQEKWRLSIFLKDLVLRDENIEWLIQNHNKDEMVLNRLLRYPINNEKIANWARSLIDNHCATTKRYNEILALALSKVNIEYYMDSVNVKDMAWAIYYSKIENKEQYLDLLLDKDSKCIDISRVALRIGANTIIEKQRALNETTL